MSNSKSSAVTGELSWMLGANTYVYFRGGFNGFDWALTGRPDSRANIGKIDWYTGYVWGGKAGEEQYTIRNGESGSVRLTHFMDNVLGGNHEIGAGIEYIYSFDRLTVARGNPLTMHYYDGDPYVERRPGPGPGRLR